MAINQGICSSFKQELLEGEHDFTLHTFKIALYTNDADLNAATTAYTTSGEVVATGYTAGGNNLTVVEPILDGTVAYVDFADSTWAASTITARGALIYNASNSNKAVAVLDFGSDRASNNGDFTVTFPAANSSNAIIRVA